MRYATITLFLLFTASAIIHAEEKNVSPDINRHYQDVDHRDWIGTFEVPGRDVYDKRLDVVKALRLKPGMSVADIGAGTGFYSLLFAEEVGPDGKVYAVDIAEGFISFIRQRAAEKGVSNIKGVLSSQKDTKLDPGSIDLAFVCDTYHHFEYPKTMLASIKKALRPGGSLVIIDFIKDPEVSSGWVMSHVRLNREAVIKEIEQAGFRLEAAPNILKSNYFLKFAKKEN